MKNLYKILIGVGIAVVVLTPTIWVSVWFYVNNKAETTDVTINSLEITGISEDSLNGNVTFTISEPTTVAATFKINKFNVSYEGSAIGYGVVDTDEFSTQQASHTTAFTLTITDEDYFQLNFINDFIDEATLPIQISATIEFTGALATIPPKTITKLVDITGLNGLPVTLQKFDLLDVTDEELQLQIEVGVENPSEVSLNIVDLFGDIYYNDTNIGNLSKSSFALTNGVNAFNVTTWLSGSNSLLSDFIGTYIANDNLMVDLDLNISLDEFSGESFKISRMINDLAIQGITTDLVSVTVDMINLDISGLPSSVTYTIDTTVIIHNPVNFNVNITNFDGLLTYDDPDGVHLQIVLLTWDYDPENNITLTPVTFDWSGSPLELVPEGSANDTYTYSDSDIEQGIRLNDEYNVDNDLHVNIIFGTVTLEIYSFIIDVPVELYNVYVPKS